MSQVINTNVASLNAQRNLQMSQTTLSTSLQRLSSGLRINSAKDDAAGLAISDRFTTQIRGINQAVRNANDGISLAQVGESALAEVTSNLQRIRELAVQSANATNSDSDRRALDLEVQQRLAEIDRIAGQTSFNGRKILDGSFGNAAFQIGANVGETINVGLSTSMRQADIGAIATATSVDLSTIIIEASDGTAGTYTSGAVSNLDFATVAGSSAEYTTDTLTASDFDAAVFTVTPPGGSAFSVDATAETFSTVAEVAAFIQGETGYAAAGFTVEAVGDTLVFTDSDNSAGNFTFGGTDAALLTAGSPTDVAGAADDTDANATFDVAVDGGSAQSVTLDQQYASAADLAADIQSQLTGVSVTADDSGALVFTSASTGTTSTVAVSNFASTSSTDEITGGTAAAGEAAVAATPLTITELTIQLGDSDAVTVAAGDYDSQTALLNAINTALGGNATASLDAETNEISFTSGENITIGGADAATVFSATEIEAGGSLDTVNVLTAANSNDAIQRIDAALTSVSELRSTFGALQNRFESTIANLQASSENLSASRSRILDADFAAETANLTRAQILQQAGVAMLAQANALPQNVLSLLR